MTVDVVGVVGAGFMGSGIAESIARAGMDVVLYEPEEPALRRAAERIERSTAHAVKRGKLTEDAAATLRGLVLSTTDMEDLARADIVIEAIVEDPRIKGEVFRDLDAALPNARFLATNTSSIPIAEIASWTERPERVLGLHFFSPVPVMQLVEIVVAIETSPDVIDEAERFAAAIGKHAVRTKDRSGFIVNMLLVPYLMAGVRMFEEGFATREDIDDAMKLGAGHPMGPLTLSDFIGLDVLCAVCDSLYEEFRRPEYAAPALMKRMVVAGHLGRKAGRGFYTYEDRS